MLASLADFGVVLVEGARRVGKSTLAADIISNEHSAHAVTLDDEEPRRAALADPAGFIAGLPKPVMIDEVQRGGPDLLLAIKADVDRNPRSGRYLLTGSANPFGGARTPDALTGRIDTIRLWPLSRREIVDSGAPNPVDRMFAGEPRWIDDAPMGRDAFVDEVIAGGFPDAIERSPRRRRAWFDAYVRSVGERDLRELSDAARLAELPAVLRMLAALSSSLLVYRELGRRLSLDHKTAKAHVKLLEMAFVARILPAWRPSLLSQETATPKIHLADSGLLAHLLRADARRLARDDQVTGRCLETFVVSEITKALEWSEVSADPFHYRTRTEEADLVLESWSGEVVAIEIKAKAGLREGDWRALSKLRDSLGERFAGGYVIHAGRQTVPLGDRLWSLPVSALWA